METEYKYFRFDDNNFFLNVDRIKDWATAKEAALEKWEILSERPWIESFYGDNCAYCILAEDSCGDCPVGIRTGKGNCEGTVFWKFVDAVYEDDHDKAKFYARRMRRQLCAIPVENIPMPEIPYEAIPEDWEEVVW